MTRAATIADEHIETAADQSAPGTPSVLVPAPRSAEHDAVVEAASDRLPADPPARLVALRNAVTGTGPYVGYVGYFVGAGLISGGIVHYPLEPARYATIAVVGAVVFLLATLFNEVLLAAERLPRPRLIRVVASSLLLSLGIGMLSGGIQHFEDFPARAATLIPVGLVVSYVAYQVRNADRPRAALLNPATLLVLLVAGALIPGLQTLVPAEPVAAHSHGAAAEPVAAEGGHAADGHTTDEHAGVGSEDHGDDHGGSTQPSAEGAAGQPHRATQAELDAALADLQARLDSVTSKLPKG